MPGFDRLASVMLFAETDAVSPMSLLVMHLISGVVFSVVGLVVFALSLWIITKIVPFSVAKEIEEDQNTALGIIIGAVMIGISIIIAAAIQG